MSYIHTSCNHVHVIMYIYIYIHMCKFKYIHVHRILFMCLDVASYISYIVICVVRSFIPYNPSPRNCRGRQRQQFRGRQLWTVLTCSPICRMCSLLESPVESKISVVRRFCSDGKQEVWIKHRLVSFKEYKQIEAVGNKHQ